MKLLVSILQLKIGLMAKLFERDRSALVDAPGEAVPEPDTEDISPTEEIFWKKPRSGWTAKNSLAAHKFILAMRCHAWQQKR